MNKRIIFWLHRVLEEKCSDAKRLQEEISVLNHQIQHFEKMHPDVQKQVLGQLVSHLDNYGWDSAIQELKELKGDE